MKKLLLLSTRSAIQLDTAAMRNCFGKNNFELFFRFFFFGLRYASCGHHFISIFLWPKEDVNLLFCLFAFDRHPHHYDDLSSQQLGVVAAAEASAASDGLFVCLSSP